MEIRLFKVYMAPEALAAVGEVLASGYIGQGPQVEEFERELTEKLKNPYILTVNSGTAALQLALRLAEVGPEDTTVSSPMTCMATNEPILAAGAHPWWADVDPQTGNLDPASLPEYPDGHRIKAVIVVHWGGNPVDLEAVWAWAAPRGIAVIEDAAHALGATYRGQPIGTLLPSRYPGLRRFTCFSFQAIKHLTCIDGGLVACQNEADQRQGKLLRWFGIDRDTPQTDFRCETDVPHWGYKFHLHDVAAAVGRANLPHLAGIVAAHQSNARWLDQHLTGVLPAAPYLARRDEGTFSACWLYTVLVPGGEARRDAFMEHVRAQDIQCSKVHARNDTHTCFARYRRALPGVDQFYSSMCCLPVGWWLSREDLARIKEAVNSFRG